MKKVRTLISLLLVLTMAATFFAGCSGSGSKSGKKELTVLTWAWGTANDQAILDALESTFKEKFPDVKLTQVMIPPTEVDKKLDAGLAAGNASDVLMLSPDWFGIRSKHFEDLAPYWEKAAMDAGTTYVPGLFESCYNAEGKLEGLPINANSVVMAYNIDLLEANGIEVPTADWTWDDFAAISKKVATGEGTDRVYGCINNWILKNMAPYFYDGAAYTDDLTKITFQEEAAVKGLQLVDDLINVDKAIPEAALEKTIPADQLFAAGKSAFYLLPGWEAGSIGEKVNGNFNYDIVTLPKTPSGNMIGINFITALGINKASKNKDLAWEYILNATTNPKVQDVIAGLCGPAAKQSAESIYAIEKMGATSTRQVFVDAFDGAPLNMWGGALSKVGDEYTRCWEDIILNGADVSASTQKYAETAQQYLDEAMNRK